MRFLTGGRNRSDSQACSARCRLGEETPLLEVKSPSDREPTVSALDPEQGGQPAPSAGARGSQAGQEQSAHMPSSRMGRVLPC